MSIVTTVLEKPGRDGGKTAILMMDDGREIWTPDYAKALPLLNKPIPEDWFQKEGEYGPQAFPPRPAGEKKGGGGGMAAWRNTKEGFAAEQAGRLRWQEVEEERRDRRTALMQAVTFAVAKVKDDYDATVQEVITGLADGMYAWLRKSPSVSASGKGGSEGGTGPGGVAPSPPREAQAPPGSTTDYPADWPVEKP